MSKNKTSQQFTVDKCIAVWLLVISIGFSFTYFYLASTLSLISFLQPKNLQDFFLLSLLVSLPLILPSVGLVLASIRIFMRRLEFEGKIISKIVISSLIIWGCLTFIQFMINNSILTEKLIQVGYTF